MQPHLLVAQLRFARSEFARGLAGVSDEDARRRLMPLNCLSWMVGHLANQEHRYWVMESRPAPRPWRRCGRFGGK
jgi:hypothetical protein